jgi:hypothetical protein
MPGLPPQRIQHREGAVSKRAAQEYIADQPLRVARWKGRTAIIVNAGKWKVETLLREILRENEQQEVAVAWQELETGMVRFFALDRLGPMESKIFSRHEATRLLVEAFSKGD